jgi:hypothetical protein
MAYGCVYKVVWAPSGSQYSEGQIIVLECKEQCVNTVINTPGPDYGTLLKAEYPDCQEYPPE